MFVLGSIKIKKLILLQQNKMRKFMFKWHKKLNQKNTKREYEQLLEIKDNYPKYVVLTDDFAGGNYQGIKTMHITDFLLSKEY